MSTVISRTNASGRRAPVVSADEIRARLSRSVVQIESTPKAAVAAAVGPRALTQREHDVVRGVAEGLGNDQIARRLGISRWTVANHLRRVMQKWDCHTRVAVAVRFSTLQHDVSRHDSTGENAS